MSVFSLISFAVYAIFPVFAFFFNKDVLLRTFFVFGFFQPAINFRYPVFLMIWLGPMLLGLTILSIAKFSKRDTVFWLWILTGAIPLIFTESNTSIDRYFMFAIPAFIILSAKFLSEVDIKKQQRIIGVFSFVVFIGQFF